MKEKNKGRIRIFIFLLLIIAAIALIWVLSKNKNTTMDSGTHSAIPVVQLTTDNTSTSESKSGIKPLTSLYIENVPHIYQAESYPTGCESVAAVSLLQYYGLDITVEDFIDNHLPKTDYPYYKNEVMFADSPWDAFIGDPYSDSGYGCYSTAIVRAMHSAVPEKYQISTLYNVPLETLFKNYVKQGHPVLIWGTIEMQEPRVGHKWTLPNGKEFTFISPEHALLLIGADNENYYFSDSMRQDAVVSYPKAACETAYAALHKQAIVINTIA